ncbi:MAG: AMP-binding protein [Alphaproteobacteria bacterium]|nr:AMP-binding protein [Alphaproteobacteria bacterium]
MPAFDLNGPQQVVFERFEEAWAEQPAISLFSQTAARYPQRIACQDAEGNLSFAEIWAGARRLAATVDRTVARDAAVGILLPNQASYPIAVLACLGAARPAVMIDRHYPQDRVAAIMRDAGCAAMIMSAADIADGYLLPAGVRPIALEDALSGGAPPGMPAEPPAPDAPSFIVYTSGSTGQPKGIVISQRAVLHRATELVNAVHLAPDDQVLSLASPGTIGGVQQIFEVMLTGASLVKLDLQRLGLGQVVRTIAERRISMMFSTPAVWRSVARLPEAKAMLASLRCIQSSGDTLLRVDYELIRSVLTQDCHVLSVYGATEAPALLQWFVTSPPADEVRVPAGWPLSDVDLAVLDEQDRPVADGDAGELVIRSRFISLGVWQNGKVVPGALQQDPDAADLKIHRTGDLVRRRADGLYVVLGRRDRQVKVLGNRVELAEIETALRQAPDVLDAAVVARRGDDDGDGEPTVLGFIVPRQGDDPRSLDKVRRHLETALPAFMRPRRLLVVDSLPLLPGRKIDEEALLELAQRDAAGVADRCGANEPAASPPSLAIVEKAWRSTLGRPPPGRHVSFEAAGGDSLQLLQLVFALERQIDRPLPMERVHVCLTCAEFARELDRVRHEGAVALADDAPAVFLFPPAGGGDAYLSAFRAACVAQMEMRQVRYPDLRALALPAMSLERIAAETVRQIDALKPGGSLTLAGYSDGGDVAFEAARQLRAKGRSVARLLVLDTDASGLAYPPPPEGPSPGPSGRFRYLRRPTADHYRRLVELFVPSRFLLTPRGRTALRLVLALRLSLPSAIGFIAAHKAYDVLFNDHHHRWSLGLDTTPLDVPIVLFRSEERRPGAPEDLGWRRRTHDLSIVPVPGDHSTMLEAAAGEAIAATFGRLIRHERVAFDG